MKRIATIAAVVTAGALAAPTVAAGGNISAQVKPQVSAQVVSVQIAKAQRATVAVTVQRALAQRVSAKRVSLLLHTYLR